MNRSYGILNGNTATAMGVNAEASGYHSIAMEDTANTTASGLSSAALCNNTISSGNSGDSVWAFELKGYLTESSGNDSTATGLETIASGASSMSMGIGTVAAGDTSVSMGYYTTTNDVGTLAIGTYNLIDATPNASGDYSIAMGARTTFSYANTAFVIGSSIAVQSKRN